MSTEPAGVHSDLVAGLLDARDTPAADRFDEELADAVASGELTAAGARRLKAWQSAAVNELAAHVRAVLPATLGALAAANNRATQRVREVAAAIEETREVVAQPSSWAGARRTPGDTPEPASGTLPPPDTSLESRPVRQLVADLVVTHPTRPTRPHHS